MTKNSWCSLSNRAQFVLPPHYYTDVIECLNFLVAELGIEKAKTLLEENELFLILYRRKEYRLQYSSLFNEAMEIVERYKNK